MLHIMVYIDTRTKPKTRKEACKNYTLLCCHVNIDIKSLFKARYMQGSDDNLGAFFAESVPVSVYLASQEIWHPRSIHPRIFCTPLGYLAPLMS